MTSNYDLCISHGYITSFSTCIMLNIIELTSITINWHQSKSSTVECSHLPVRSPRMVFISVFLATFRFELLAEEQVKWLRDRTRLGSAEAAGWCGWWMDDGWWMMARAARVIRPTPCLKWMNFTEFHSWTSRMFFDWEIAVEISENRSMPQPGSRWWWQAIAVRAVCKTERGLPEPQVSQNVEIRHEIYRNPQINSNKFNVVHSQIIIVIWGFKPSPNGMFLGPHYCQRVHRTASWITRLRPQVQPFDLCEKSERKSFIAQHRYHGKTKVSEEFEWVQAFGTICVCLKNLTHWLLMVYHHFLTKVAIKCGIPPKDVVLAGYILQEEFDEKE